MIDTHCHLTDERLHSQLAGVLARAQAAGVLRMVTIGTGLADAARCIELCRAHPNVRCAIGVHPNHSHEVELSQLPALRQLQADSSVLALGEMGLDYHHAFSPRERQHAVFEFQLNLAADLKRPVVVHCREAMDDCLSVMRNFPTIRAVFHCFTGNRQEARRVLDAGYLLGFTGPVTYKKSDELREVVKLVPDNRLLVETDAPYLTPEPMRKQKTNEPALVMHTAATVASMKGKTLEELDELTTRNAMEFYGEGLR